MTRQSIKRLINFVAFIVVVATTALVLVGKLIPSIADVMFMIAGILCFLVCLFAGGFFAFTRRNSMYLSIFIVCVLIVIISLIVL